MSSLPNRLSQILAANSRLIRQTVMAAQNRELLTQLEPILAASENNGWTALVAAIRQILKGRRDESLLAGLDEEDTVVVKAILNGLHDPSTLDDIEHGADPVFAAPGLATMIDSAAKGNSDSLQLLAHLAEQMTHMPGDMARLGAIMRRLINGERDAEQLCKGMGPRGEKLVVSILAELGRQGTH
jgi:hypothetical protein